MSARYYDGVAGRFLSEDPAFLAVGDAKKLKELSKLDQSAVLADPQLSNSYSYARNNPVINRDADGNFIFLAPLLIPAAITAVATIGAALATWQWGLGVGYMMEGDNATANRNFDASMNSTALTGMGVYGLMEMSAAAESESKPVDKNTAAINSRSGVHGNCLDCGKQNTGYSLRDKTTGQIMKFGETTRPESRYSQTYLNSNNVELKPEVVGTKPEIHQWQHEQILNYKEANGARPPLNKSDW